MYDFSNLFADAETKVKQGLGRLIEAKVTEKVERIERASDPLRNAVNGATVSPRDPLTMTRENSPVDTTEGVSSMTKGALIVLAVLAAGAVLRKLG